MKNSFNKNKNFSNSVNMRRFNRKHLRSGSLTGGDYSIKNRYLTVRIEIR